MKYIGTYSDPQDIAVKKNVDAVADRVTTAEGEIDALQTAVDGKQATITGGATTITSSNLTTNRALVSNGSGKVAVSDVTSTELGYLDGVTGAIQTQLDGKVPNTRKVNNRALSADITLTASDVGALPSTTSYVSSVDGASGAVTTNAVKTTAQTLTDEQKAQARTNIGAGTSSFSGSYNDLSDKPTIPTKTSDLTNDSNYITSAEAPVQSVNTKTGAVTLTKSDIGLSNVDNVKQYSTSNPPPYPVTSVNNKTGAVVLDASDVGALPDTTVIPTIPDNLVQYTAISAVQDVDTLNADTLEGHSASYFATATELSATNAQVASLNSGLSTANNNISALQTTTANKLDKSGGTMTGALVAQSNTNYTTAQVRNVIISTADPSGGSNGMIWIKYTP